MSQKRYADRQAAESCTADPVGSMPGNKAGRELRLITVHQVTTQHHPGKCAPVNPGISVRICVHPPISQESKKIPDNRELQPVHMTKVYIEP